MGHAITQYKRGLTITRRNPKYVGVMAVAFIVALVVGGGLGLVPLVGPLVNNFVVAPLFAAGVLGLAYAVSEGQFSPRAFVASVKANWKSLLGAYALMMIAMVGVLFLTVILPAVLGTFVLGFGAATVGGLGGTGGSGALGLLSGASLFFVLLVGLISIPAILVVALVVQFVPVSIVVGGESATSSFRASWDVFRSNVLSVTGYSLLRGVTGALVFAVPVAFAFAGSMYGDTTVALALGGVGFLLTVPFGYAFFNAYHVLYYRSLRGDPSAAA